MSTHPSACILCSRNCGIEVTVDDGRITKVRGDAQHPISHGYLCQKAARLEYYQDKTDRLDSPLRRKADGTFESIGWDTAISEIAAKLVHIRSQHGGRSFAFYGGGGQGNHLGGIYGHSLLSAMGSKYHYSALAQEKTGDFWVNGKLFGRQTCHTTEDVENAEMIVFIGTNPWQAHGIPNARDTVREIAKDPERTMVVIDPRRTETADLANIHLQLRPSTDAFLLTAIIAILIRDDLVDHEFIAAHTSGWEEVRSAFADAPIEALVSKADVSLEDVERVAHALGKANSACIRVDLGIQQSLNSTLNSYLEKLLFLLTGNFAKSGANNLHTFLLPLIGHSDDSDANWRTVVSDYPGIGKLYPPNVLPEEIDNEHPDRIRALVVDSANPALSGADTQAYERALGKLDLLVVVDVALTETARHAHYVLPATSQFEKWEATFFNLEFPTNGFHLRKPLLEPLPNTLPEPEIYRRLLVAMGEIPSGFPILRGLAGMSRKLFTGALGATLKLRPKLQKYATFVLSQTLGQTLPDGAYAAAPLWYGCQVYARKHGEAVRRAGIRGANLGDALFERILTSPHGCTISTHQYEDVWKMVRTPDKRVSLSIPRLLEQIKNLSQGSDSNEEFPFILIAGERRAYNANTILRDPSWRKKDKDGALRIHPSDAASLSLKDGDRAVCASRAGQVEVRVQLCDTLRPGMVTLPHGYGMKHSTTEEGANSEGPWINRLTSAAHRDPIAATPFHKHVPVRVTPA